MNFKDEDPYLIDNTANKMMLRRSHFDGFFFQWTTSAQFNTMHAWVNNLQVSEMLSSLMNNAVRTYWRDKLTKKGVYLCKIYRTC